MAKKSSLETMFNERMSRSFYKALTWRLVGTFTMSLFIYVFTGRLDLTVGFGLVDITSKIFLYTIHERIWDRIQFGKKRVEPVVVWLTGLSGAGKSTIAERLCERLRDMGLPCEPLDGDTVRNILPGTGFTAAMRNDHVRRVGYLASRLEDHGVFVIASFISPYRESRDFVRGLCHRFMEVHVATPLDVCEERDVKGLYRRARRGEIKNFTGIDDPYEAPLNPELVLDTSCVGLDDAVEQILRALLTRAPLRSPVKKPILNPIPEPKLPPELDVQL